MATNIRYILLTALRDWLFVALMTGVLFCALIAHVLGSTALVETTEMTLVYTSATARFVIVSGLLVFACFHIRNAFDTREIDMFLSRPIARSGLVFSYWLGFAVLSLLLTLPTIGFVALQGILDKKGFVLWALSLEVECWLAVAVAMFFAFTLRSAVTSVLASLGVYAFGRMMGFFLGLVHLSATGKQGGALTQLGEFFIPRLDFFSRSEWLVYGVHNMAEYTLALQQAAFFIPVLILATVLDFRRKQF